MSCGLCGVFCLVFALGSWACAEEPIVTLGSVVDADDPRDEDTMIDEAERERVFRELAERECREDEPVCGTDGVTYRNYCQAVANGAQVNGVGVCLTPRPPPPIPQM